LSSDSKIQMKEYSGDFRISAFGQFSFRLLHFDQVS